MNKEMMKNTLIVLLASITLFSAFKYISSLKEKDDLVNNINAAKQRLITLEKDRESLWLELNKEKESKEQLNAKLEGARGYLRASKKRLAKLFMDYEQAQETVEDLNSQSSVLKVENKVLREEKDKLATQLIQVVQENKTLRVKLNSIPALKKAVKELKIRLHKEGAELRRRVDKKELLEGNRGFLLKDGKYTYPAKVKIEVTPVPFSK